MIRLIGTLFYFGLFPFAPGTVGSILAIIIGIILFKLIGIIYFCICIFFIFFIGWWVCNKFMLKTKNKDPSEIIVDELVGQWITLLPVFWFAEKNFESTNIPIFELFLALILFRIFDIIKIGPMKWADNLTSGLGVMLDDLFAGILSALILLLYLLVT
jgi:phosphatidylglycerophosphatase A